MDTHKRTFTYYEEFLRIIQRKREKSIKKNLMEMGFISEHGLTLSGMHLLKDVSKILKYL